MKAIILITGFAITIAVCLVNISLLWDLTGTGLLLSEILSALTCFLILAYSFIPSGVKWVLASKLFAIIVMISPLFFDEYRRFLSFDPANWYLPLNITLIPICIVSIRAIHRKHFSELTKARSSNS
ncbi:MAG: hypothetical protein P8P74_02820 [Crocinitomicaceae bacterium]|nr:hypothetical protein [Crocinitomicaceae bacterium]